MYSRKSTQFKEVKMSTNDVRYLRGTRHQTIKAQQYFETVKQSKRGRGRPRKTNFGRPLQLNTEEESPPHIELIEDFNYERNVIQQSDGDILVTLDNEEAPHLIRQTMDIDERMKGPSDEMQSLSNEAPNRGQLCSRYLKICKDLTQSIERENIEKSNLVTALKYALVKCNLGNHDICLDLIKSASVEMALGISWEIEGDRPQQSNTSMGRRVNWKGRTYSPQM